MINFTLILVSVTILLQAKPSNALYFLAQTNQQFENKKLLEKLKLEQTNYQIQNVKEQQLSAGDYFRKGVQAYVQKEYNLAIFYWTQAILLRPNYLIAYNNRGVAFYTQNKFGEALKDYNKALKLNPDFANAYFNRGNVYRKQKYYEKAIQDYSKAIELNPEDIDAYHNRGVAFKEQRNYIKACQDAKKVYKAMGETRLYKWLNTKKHCDFQGL